MSISDQQLLQTMQTIGGLLFRRLHDELSEQDRIVLEEWMAQQAPSSRQFFEEATDWEHVHIALQEMYQIDTQSAFEDVQKKIHLESVLSISTSVEPRRRFDRKYPFIAAAAFTLFIGLSVVFTLSKRKIDLSSLPAAQRFKNDVAPGGEKALLTLEDGSQIVLDSASNGELAKQGSTRVMKLGHGQLAYKASSTISSSIIYNTISTPRGGQYQVVLPDGSKIWLNAASSIRFPATFSGRERMVELTGEAYFQVAKNSSIPFKISLISNKATQIEVLGTELDVNAYSDEENQKITLINGAVKVTLGTKEATLDPGQQARVGTSLNVISNANIEEAIAWKNGLFQFQDASIQSIMRQVGRWYDVDIVYKGAVDQQFVGKIPRQIHVSTLLKILESTGWVHFMIEGKKITVAP